MTARARWAVVLLAVVLAGGAVVCVALMKRGPARTAASAKPVAEELETKRLMAEAGKKGTPYGNKAYDDLRDRWRARCRERDVTMADLQSFADFCLKLGDNKGAREWKPKAWDVFIAPVPAEQVTLAELREVLRFNGVTNLSPGHPWQPRSVEVLTCLLKRKELDAPALEEWLDTRWRISAVVPEHPGMHQTHMVPAPDNTETRLILDAVSRCGRPPGALSDASYRTAAELMQTPEGRRDVDARLVDETGWVDLAMAKVTWGIAGCYQGSPIDYSARIYPIAGRFKAMEKAGLTGDALALCRLAGGYGFFRAPGATWRENGRAEFDLALDAAESDDMRAICIREIASAARASGEYDYAIRAAERVAEASSGECRSLAEAVRKEMQALKQAVAPKKK